MSNVLEGKRIAILATDGVERRELEEPVEAVLQASGHTELLSLELGIIDARDHDLLPAGEFRVDREVGDAAVDGNLISSRSPDDLPAFCRAIVGRFGSV